MLKIAVLDDYQHVALELADWKSLAGETQVTVFSDHLSDESALAARLHDFDVVCGMRERTPFPRSLLQRLPKLKLLLTTGARNASYDVAAATELGIVVCGTGGSGSATAELTWGLILALLRHIPQEDAAARQGKWQTTIGVEVEGKTLGVIGLGRLGSRVASIGKAFGMHVIAWSQNLTKERAAEVGATLVTKEDLFRRADIITIHLVLSERTRGLVGKAELAQTKPTAYLVNPSRRPSVDEPALAQNLEPKAIAGAGLDVFSEEPLPKDHAFLRLPNTVITPHLGYVTRESYKPFLEQTVEDIAAYLKGSPVRVINPEVLPKARPR